MPVLFMVVAMLWAAAASPTASPSPPSGYQALHPPAPGAPQTTIHGLSANEIFAKARLAMYLRRYPRYVAYVIDIQSNAYGKHYHEGYRALLRTHDDALVVHQTPIYTSNEPPNPYGFSFFGINPEGKPRDHIDPPSGVPLMSATYDFDLARGPSPRRYGGDDDASSSPAPVIGTIAVNASDYAVTFLGEDSIDGNPVYHLGLSALDDPQHNRVRELWVDESTYDVRKLVTDGIFEKGPASTVPWTVTFIDLHGWWFIRTELTTATLRGPGHFLSAGTEYDGVEYTFGRYEYPGLISDLEFTDFGISTDAVQE